MDELCTTVIQEVPTEEASQKFRKTIIKRFGALVPVKVTAS